MGARYQVASIRDQMLRAVMLIDRAALQGLIGEDRALLVVGCGASGATAALAATAKRIRVLLIDRAYPFFRQANCETRWLDPVQYDWPMPHWNLASFPIPRTRELPLPFEASAPADLALKWRARLDTEMGSGFLERREPCSLDSGQVPSYSKANGKNVVHVAGFPQDFGMVLCCHGYPHERRFNTGFRAVEFWDNDDFEKPLAGTNRNAPVRICISGGGDGGLQEFLRIATGCKSAGQLYESLFRGEPELSARIEREIHCAEDQALRLHLCGGNEFDHKGLIELERIHKQTIATLMDGRPESDRLIEPLDRILQQRVVGQMDVQFAFSCTHFGKAYAFNRWLGLLVAERLRTKFAIRCLRPGTRVTHVTAIGASCANNAIGCLDHDHNVQSTMDDCPNARHLHASPSPPLHGPFQLVILRHGAEPGERLFEAETEATKRRFAFPYYLPVQ